MSKLLNNLSSQEGYRKVEVFHNFIRTKAFERNIPLSGSFELTPLCTLDCKMCYVHLSKGKMKQPELPTEKWLSLIDEACEAGMLYATLTGGECLIYPGFKQIYEHLQSKGVFVSIFTNATLLDSELVNWLSERKPYNVQITVYGSSPEGYAKVTGSADAFYKVDNAIGLLKQANIPFHLAITASKYMAHDFEALYRYCKTKEPLSINFCSFPFQARNETEREYFNYAPSIDEQVDFFKTRLKVDGTHSITINHEDNFENDQLQITNNDQPELKGIQCEAGRIKFSISWDGKMLGCSSFDFAQAYPLKEGFANAWKHINKRANEYVMPVECNNCKYKKACIKCPAAHWLSSGEGHCNPLICEEGKRMVAEGLREL